VYDAAKKAVSLDLRAMVTLFIAGAFALALCHGFGSKSTELRLNGLLNAKEQQLRSQTDAAIAATASFTSVMKENEALLEKLGPDQCSLSDPHMKNGSVVVAQGLDVGATHAPSGTEIVRFKRPPVSSSKAYFGSRLCENLANLGNAPPHPVSPYERCVVSRVLTGASALVDAECLFRRFVVGVIRKCEAKGQCPDRENVTFSSQFSCELPDELEKALNECSEEKSISCENPEPYLWAPAIWLDVTCRGAVGRLVSYDRVLPSRHRAECVCPSDDRCKWVQIKTN
jgi:hypothetical protein